MTNSTGLGLGLGLSICRTIVRAHGGEIRAENRSEPEPVSGLYFRCTEKSRRMGTGGATVYLLDDDPTVLRALTRLIRAEGYLVAPYDSPSRFLAEHDPRIPGCAVLDLSMPELDGMAVAKALQPAENAQAPRPVIFLTGHGDIRTGVQAMRQGAVDFLTKPVDASQLIEAIHRAIELDERSRRALAREVEHRSLLSRLTPREREVMGLVVRGMLNKQIAMALGTTEGTIKVHRARVMSKLEVESLADLVRFGESVGESEAGVYGRSTKTSFHNP